MAREQEPPLIIEYTTLLHRHRNPDAPEVQAFVQQHKDDPVFLVRVRTLNRVFKLKEDLIG